MRANIFTAAIVAAISLTSVQSHAEEQGKKPEKKWKTAIELGFNMTSGNTDTSSLKTRVDVKHHLDQWDNNYIFDALRAENDDRESANKWLLSVKGHYKLDREDAFFFVEGSREEDKFGAFDDYNSAAVGYGERLYSNGDLTIDGDVGPGIVRFKKHDSPDNDTSAIIRLSGHLAWKISDNANFSQKVMITQELEDQKNTKSRLESAVSARINGSLQMKFSLTIINNTEVDEGTKKTDTETAVTLVYAF